MNMQNDDVSVQLPLKLIIIHNLVLNDSFNVS